MNMKKFSFTTVALFVALLLTVTLQQDTYATEVGIDYIASSTLPRIDINFDEVQSVDAYNLPSETIDFYHLNKEDYALATVSVSNAGGFNLEPQVQTGVRLRGNSTATAPKKPVRLKIDSKVSMFGRPAAKSWTLLANYYDKTLLHNITAYNLYTYLGAEFSSIAIPVDVFVNGTYYGVYTLCDQIQAGSGRIEIEDNFSDDPAATDYLLEQDLYSRLEDGDVYLPSPFAGDASIVFKTPDIDDYPDADFSKHTAYMQDYLHQVNTAVR